MTDTTDMAALMLKMRNLADRIIDAEGENNNGEVGKIIEMYDDADTTFKAENILLVLNAFEAERQRADDCNKSAKYSAATNKSVVATNCRLQEEIAALKGEQVPVAYTDKLSLETLQGNGMACMWKQGQGAEWREQIALFTAPQKPCDCEYTVNDTRSTCLYCGAAIEAAGGKVAE